MSRSRCGWCWALLAVVACSDAPSAERPTPVLSECTEAWEILYTRQGENLYAPQRMHWQAGNLYYREDFGEDQGVAQPPGFVVMSDEGGTPRRIVEDAGREFWLEDEQLLYAAGDRLYAAPIEGGTGELVSDGGMFGMERRRKRNVTITAYALSESHLYWTTFEYGDERTIVGVWRSARSAGSSELLAVLPEAARLIDTLVVLPDTLLAVPSSGVAYRVPRSGGDAEPLPEVEDGQLVGAAESGILWSLFQVRGENTSRDLWLSKPTGAKPKPFWPNKDRRIEPAHAWSDDRAWVFYATESFSDGHEHLSVWSVEPDGDAARLACDPEARMTGVFAMAGVLSPDAAMLAVQRAAGWELVKVRR